MIVVVRMTKRIPSPGEGRTWLRLGRMFSRDVKGVYVQSEVWIYQAQRDVSELPGDNMRSLHHPR